MSIRVDADFSGLDYYSGVVIGFSEAMNTNRYKRSVSMHARTIMIDKFDKHMDMMALNNPARLFHMYEWREIGSPTGRLWTHIFSGRGGNIVSTVEFLPSRSYVLTPEERSKNPRDPASAMPEKLVASLSKKKYVFYNKASIMERGTAVTIRPRGKQGLVIPSFSANQGFFRIKANQSLTNNNPGGSQTTGAFSFYWGEFWMGAGEKMFKDAVTDTIENKLGMIEGEMRARTTKSRTKNISLGMSDDFKFGRDKGKKFVEKLEKNFAD